jgi:hypothetical protein
LDKHAMDVDTAEALAGVVGLLRQAALRAWAATDRAGARSPGQLFAFGVDLAADQARDLVPDCNRHRRSGARLWRTGRPDDVGGASVSGLMASLDSYHLDLVLAVLGHAGSGGPTRNSSNDPKAVIVMTDDGRDRFRCLTRIATARRARPRQSLRERLLRPSQPDLGASLVDYPGLP